MTEVVELLSTFVESLAVLLALVFMLSVVHRGGRACRLRDKVLMGGMFAVAIVFSMADPIVLPFKVGVCDMRTLLVGTAAGLLGPIVGGIAFATALFFRDIIGDPGVLAGEFGLLIAFMAGLSWHLFVRGRQMDTWKKSVILGMMLSLQLVAIFLEPVGEWGVLFMSFAPFMIAANIAGSLTVNHLLSGELSFLSEAEASRIDANTDHLTGLLNRRGLEVMYPKRIGGSHSSEGQALLYFDVDRFKRTNDTFGHAVGDDVLRYVVDQVAANLRPKDTFVRLGGDEFVVVLPDVTPSEAETIGERCRSAISNNSFKVDRTTVTLSISVGAVWAAQPARVDTLLGFADKALYQAKEMGRNCVVFIQRNSTEVGQMPEFC